MSKLRIIIICIAVIMMAVAIIACENEGEEAYSIKHCGYACNNVWNKGMHHYNKVDGCRCISDECKKSDTGK